MRMMQAVIAGLSLAGCDPDAAQGMADEGMLVGDDAMMATPPEDPDRDCPQLRASDLPGVQLHLDLPRCTYTLAELDEGVDADYGLVIEHAVADVTSNEGCLGGPPGSLLVSWFLASEQTLGCDLDEDDSLCLPEHQAPRWEDLAPAGSRSASFRLIGRSNAPSLCYPADLPGGVPGLDPALQLHEIEAVESFAPGRYVVSVVASGERLVDGEQVHFRVSASREIEVVP